MPARLIHQKREGIEWDHTGRVAPEEVEEGRLSAIGRHNPGLRDHLAQGLAEEEFRDGGVEEKNSYCQQV